MLIALTLAALVGSASQATQAGKDETPRSSGAPERSHVERFATPRDRAQRAEADATARLKVNASDVDTLADRAGARLRLGKLNESLADFRRAADLAPYRADVLTSYGYVLGRLNRRTDALQVLRRALALEPNEPFANYHFGRLLLASGGEPKTAIVHLERALTTRPDLTDIRFDLVTAYRAIGELALASAQLRYLKEARPRDPRVVYVDGLLASDRGDIATAIERFRRALELAPRLLNARRDLALALIREQRWQEATPMLDELVRLAPTSFEFAYLRALTLFNGGAGDAAETSARDLVRRFPNASPAHTLLGTVLLSRGTGPNEARAALEAAARLDPSSFDARLALGRLQFGERDYDAAAESFARAVDSRPEDVRARFFHATALEYAGKVDAASAQYEELARRSPTSAEGFIGLGAVQARRGEFDAAVTSLRRAVELGSSLFEGHYRLGSALARLGRLDEAIASLERAVALEPQRPDAHYQLGLALRRAGRATEAEREFAIVERLNSEFRNRTGGMGT
jgi:tetratricopeptide (TPR) repeat protein